MKTYRVALSSLGTVLVEADSYEENEKTVVFYRGGQPFAQYAKPLVKSVEVREVATRPFPMTEREDSQAP